jgi:hypothetical protein
MTSRQVLETLVQAFPGATRRWAEKIRLLEPNALESILKEIPGEFISEPARRFAFRVLAYNHAMIREVANA